MPLNAKGEKILGNMKKQYGEDKGKQAFYASENSGKIKGVTDPRRPRRSTNGARSKERAAHMNYRQKG